LDRTLFPYTTLFRSKNKFDIVYPSITILTEPSVAIVDRTLEKNGNKWLATGYINYLYSPLGQEMAAKHFYRPRNEKVLAKYSARSEEHTSELQSREK